MDQKILYLIEIYLIIIIFNSSKLHYIKPAIIVHGSPDLIMYVYELYPKDIQVG